VVRRNWDSKTSFLLCDKTRSSGRGTPKNSENKLSANPNRLAAFWRRSNRRSLFPILAEYLQMRGLGWPIKMPYFLEEPIFPFPDALINRLAPFLFIDFSI